MDRFAPPPIDMATGLPIDPLTGTPLNPAMMAGGPPPMIDPTTGMPMDPSMLAAAPMQAPPMPQPEPPPEPEPIDPMVGFIEVLLSGDADAIKQLLDGMDRVALAMLRDLVEEEIKPEYPDQAKKILALLPAKPTGGTLPSWMKSPPPKPDAARVHELATDDAAFWEQVVQNDRDTMEYLLPPYKSQVFKSFDKAKDEQYISPMLRNEINLIVNKGSASGYFYRMPVFDPAHADMAQKCEDYLYECDRQAQRNANRANDGDVERNEWYSETTKGRVMTLIQPNMESCDSFLSEKTMDPSSTFPVWDGHRGLTRVTRIYDAMLSDAIGDYDVPESKIIGKEIKNKRELYSTKSWVKVTCYWDRWWYVVLFDDIEIINEPHKYGFVPFAITGSNVGLPKFMGEARTNLTSGHATHEESMLKLKYASHIDGMKDFNGYREAIITVLQTVLSKMGKEALIIEQDPVAASQGTPTISKDINAVSPVQKDRENVIPVPELNGSQQALQPFLNMFGQDAATTFMPGESHGVSAGANQSGNALENMFEVGNDKMVPHYKSLQAHKSAKNELRLQLWCDWGHLWKDKRGKTGKMAVPYSAARRVTMAYDAPPSFDFLPEIVATVGCVVDTEYTQIRTNNLTQLGNAYMIWNQGNAMSAREAMEMRGVTDPDAVFQQIAYEKLMFDPDIMKAMGMDELRKRNPALADKIETASSSSGSGGPPQIQSLNPNSSAMNLTSIGLGAQGPTGRPAVGGGVGIGPL